MPSFDIVSELDMQELDNAVNQVVREMSTRFDFRGGHSSLSLDKRQKEIMVVADDSMKLRSIHQLLEGRLAKRRIDLRVLDYGQEQCASGNLIRQTVKLCSGIKKEDAQSIIKKIKETRLKVQAQIQDEQVRVTAKKIDDLQEVIAMLKGANLLVPLQYINMRN